MFCIQASDIRFSVRKRKLNHIQKIYIRIVGGFHLKRFLEFDLIIVLYIVVSMFLHKLYEKCLKHLALLNVMLLLGLKSNTDKFISLLIAIVTVIGQQIMKRGENRSNKVSLFVRLFGINN